MRQMIISALLAAAAAMALAGCGSGGGGGGGGQGSVAPGGEPGTVALLGTTFDPATSQQLYTELTLPMTQNWVDRPDPTKPKSQSTKQLSADTRRGIPCVRVNGGSKDIRWFAKDTLGRVICIQAAQDNGTLYEPVVMADTYHYPTRNLTVGDSWTCQEASGPVVWEIVSTNATAPRNHTTGCTLFRKTRGSNTVATGDDVVSYLWWSNDTGEVELSDKQELDTDAGYSYVHYPAG